jgi:leucyl-tRNA---protein transferase
MTTETDKNSVNRLSNTELFTSPPHPCSYLPDRTTVLLFVDPYSSITHEHYDILIKQGFRRSGRYIYRPVCRKCQACKSIRVDVARFAPNRSQRRTWHKNADITITEVKPAYNDEYVSLYHRYLLDRHKGGGMDTQDPKRYLDFLISEWSNTAVFEFRVKGKLIGVTTADVLEDGLSAVYTFFDPEQSARGLGTFAILWLLQLAKQRELPWVYLGYWIEESRKMRYKSAFGPHEVFVLGTWQAGTTADHSSV